MKLTLSSCQIGTCGINNRFVMTAANLGWCEDGYITEKVIDFYRERARGQVGLIIAGAAGIDPVRVNCTGMMQIYDDRFIEPMKKLTNTLHKEGSKIFLQLMHAGAYARRDEHQGREAVAPSTYLCSFTREETKALEEKEIGQIISWFRDGAVRAKKAGFDGIELIGSAGYLIAEFLSRAVNHRTDTYGGTLKNRTKFLLDILEAVRDGVGNDYPVIVRLSGADFVSGGNRPEDVAEIAKLIQDKADAIDITGGWHESQVPQITGNVPRGMYLYLAKAVKDSVSVPVIGCNRMDVDTAEYCLEKGYTDMVGMLRAFIAEPHLVKKYKEGRKEEIRPCLSCNQECLDAVFSGKGIGCVVNPLAGKEEIIKERASEEKKVAVKNKGLAGKQKILVVGAGISGMVYAALAAKKGCHVAVWEKSLNYGGTANAVAKLPYREEVKPYIDYLFRQCVLSGVQFFWKKEAGMKELQELSEKKKFDKIIIAAGAKPGQPKWEIAQDAPVYSLKESILSEDMLKKSILGRNIVIIGSGYQSVQTALYCIDAEKTGQKEQEFLEKYAPEQLNFADNMMKWGKVNITLLAAGKKVGGGLGKSTRWMMLKEIKEKGVVVETEAVVKRVEKNRVMYWQGGEEKSIPADTIIIGEGGKAQEEFLSLCKTFTDRTEIIGDAKQPGRISEAVKHAFDAAMRLKEGNDV